MPTNQGIRQLQQQQCSEMATANRNGEMATEELQRNDGNRALVRKTGHTWNFSRKMALARNLWAGMDIEIELLKWAVPKSECAWPDQISRHVHRSDSNVPGIFLNFVYNCIIWRMQAEIGIVYNPITEELFTARVGEGAFCNGTKLQVTSVEGIQWFIWVSYRNLQNSVSSRS